MFGCNRYRSKFIPHRKLPATHAWIVISVRGALLILITPFIKSVNIMLLKKAVRHIHSMCAFDSVCLTVLPSENGDYRAGQAAVEACVLKCTSSLRYIACIPSCYNLSGHTNSPHSSPSANTLRVFRDLKT